VSLRHNIRLMVRKMGLDISRYPGFDPVYMLVRLLNAHKVNVVLDVGANCGQYGTELRQAGYAGRIVSFEPIAEAFQALSDTKARDPLWQAHPYAIGDDNGVVTLHVAGNGAKSSSILPMLDLHSESCPDADYVRMQQAELRTLDSLNILEPGERAFLKADVQGYEKAVLNGARETLNSCQGIQLELSFAPLYEGGMLYREAMDTAESLGFFPMGLIPGFQDPADGRLLQADGIFMRGSNG
jgi:FkbM family methyltransferase